MQPPSPRHIDTLIGQSATYNNKKGVVIEESGIWVRIRFTDHSAEWLQIKNVTFHNVWIFY